MNVRNLAAYLQPGWKPHGAVPAGQLVADRLLTDAKIAMVPGTAFGRCSPDYVRMSFPGPPDKLDEAVRRLQVLTCGPMSELGTSRCES